MTSSKNKILGIITIAFVSLLQMIGIVFLINSLLHNVEEYLFFWIDTSIPLIILLSIWQGKNIGSTVKHTQVSKKNRKLVLIEVTNKITIITSLVTLFFIVSFFITLHNQGIDLYSLIEDTRSQAGLIISIFIIFATHQLMTILTSRITLLVLKKIIN